MNSDLTKGGFTVSQLKDLSAKHVNRSDGLDQEIATCRGMVDWILSSDLPENQKLSASRSLYETIAKLTATNSREGLRSGRLLTRETCMRLAQSLGEVVARTVKPFVTELEYQSICDELVIEIDTLISEVANTSESVRKFNRARDV